MVEQGKLFLPPDYKYESGPLIFLGGPIKGSARWQDQAIATITGLDSSINIATPRRASSTFKSFTDQEHIDQDRWERFHLDKAGEKGAILFWMARETVHNCERPHGKTTGREFGRYLERHLTRGYKVVVGIEQGFSSARYDRLLLADEYPKVTVFSTLNETCIKAVELATQRR